MISVIIPTHNRSNLIIRAINSVLNQTIKNIPIEIIVVSDGSTDDTKKVVEKIESEAIRFIEYFPSINGNHARNIGVENAIGEYIAFLDDDDEWYPQKLERQLEVMQNTGCGFSYTGVNIVYVNENISYLSIPTNAGNLQKKILLENCIGSTSTIIIEKDIFEKSGGFDETLEALQDYDLWIRICQLTDVCVVSEPMINYYNYTNQNQVSSFTKKYEEAFKLMETKYAYLVSALSEDEKNEREKNKLSLLANKNLRNNDKKSARVLARVIMKKGFYKSSIKIYIASFLKYKRVLQIRQKQR